MLVGAAVDRRLTAGGCCRFLKFDRVPVAAVLRPWLFSCCLPLPTCSRRALASSPRPPPSPPPLSTPNPPSLPPSCVLQMEGIWRASLPEDQFGLYELPEVRARQLRAPLCHAGPSASFIWTPARLFADTERLPKRQTGNTARQTERLPGASCPPALPDPPQRFRHLDPEGGRNPSARPSARLPFTHRTASLAACTQRFRYLDSLDPEGGDPFSFRDVKDPEKGAPGYPRLQVRAALCCAVLCCACSPLCVLRAPRRGRPGTRAPQVRAVLCCAVLCCAVLCCAVLCCAVLCCACSPLCHTRLGTRACRCVDGCCGCGRVFLLHCAVPVKRGCGRIGRRLLLGPSPNTPSVCTMPPDLPPAD